MTARAIPIEAIRIDGGTQLRNSIDERIVADYAECMEAGAKFPPVVIFHDGVDMWLADGFHRFHAARQNDYPEIIADVREGTRRDAVLFAVSCNAQHGLRPSREDTRKAVRALLADEEWGKWSDREIGRRCGCDGKTVASIRADLSAEFPQMQGRMVERGGTVYEMERKTVSVQVTVSSPETKSISIPVGDGEEGTEPPKKKPGRPVTKTSKYGLPLDRGITDEDVDKAWANAEKQAKKKDWKGLCFAVNKLSAATGSLFYWDDKEAKQYSRNQEKFVLPEEKQGGVH